MECTPHFSPALRFQGRKRRRYSRSCRAQTLPTYRLNDLKYVFRSEFLNFAAGVAICDCALCVCETQVKGFMNVLYFFIHAFFPIRTGAHVRLLQTVQSLSRLGFNVSSAYPEMAYWPQTESQRRQIEALLFENTYRYSEDQADTRVIEKPSGFWDEVNEEMTSAEYRPDYFGCVDSSMRKWFSQCLEDSKAQAVILPYPRYSALLHVHIDFV